MGFSELPGGFAAFGRTEEARWSFTRLCHWFLAEAPTYKNRFEGLWLWSELGREDDAGIDIVACGAGGDYWAIQAREPNGRPAEADLGRFLKSTSRMPFRRRMLMCGAGDAGSENMRLIHGSAGQPMEIVLEKDFLQSGLDWSRWSDRAQGTEKQMSRPPQNLLKLLDTLSAELILSWADEHHERTSQWPSAKSGEVGAAPGEKWRNVDNALKYGLRGVPGGTSLARFLHLRRGAKNRQSITRLTEELILAWSEKYHEKFGDWPTKRDGVVEGTTWHAIDIALRKGFRGLPKGSTLAAFLRVHRGVMTRADLPKLTENRILAWADEHFKRTDQWPMENSGAVCAAPDEKWKNIDYALRNGLRGMPGGISLAKLLHLSRGVKNRHSITKLTEKRILAWADEHHKRNGRWPTRSSGVVSGTTWCAINIALNQGHRGLPEGSTLAAFLRLHRKVKTGSYQSRLSAGKILSWAKEHRKRTGRWPTKNAGLVGLAHEEKWRNIDNALRYGLRGMAGGSSLWKLLHLHRGVINQALGR